MQRTSITRNNFLPGTHLVHMGRDSREIIVDIMPCLRTYAPPRNQTHYPLIMSREHEPIQYSAPTWKRNLNFQWFTDIIFAIEWYIREGGFHFGGVTLYMWPCITKPTKSRMAQFCVMARNRWSGSAWVIFRFWYILKEQSFFYIILKFGSIKRIISRGFCRFSRTIFLRPDGSCDHNTCHIISLYFII